jgi:hypothetical protein
MSLDSSLRAVVVALTESQWQVQPFQAHTQCSQHDSSGDICAVLGPLGGKLTKLLVYSARSTCLTMW